MPEDSFTQPVRTMDNIIHNNSSLIKMVDQKVAVITVHDVNPSHSEKIFRTLDELNKLKIKYNLSIVPYYDKKYDLKNDVNFCNRISSLLRSAKNNVELTLHGLYHQVDGQLDDFDTHTKEEEKNEIQQGLDILSSANLPRPSTFIPPAWHLSRQAIEALKELNFNVSESLTELDFIQTAKKYLLHPVMNWDEQGDKEKNKHTLKQNKQMFYKRLFNISGETYGLFRIAIHPPYDPDEALADQIEMIKHLRDKESYRFMTYLDLQRSYLQMRKVDVIGTSPSSVIADVPIPTTTTTTTAASTSATAASIQNIESDGKREKPISIEYKEQQYPNKEDKEEETELVESLNKITDRSKKDIQVSIAKLERRDIERIKDLCKNYNKLQKYSKLITDTDDLQKFKTALQNEIGKKLSDYQLQHAANSIKKTKLYLENVLDGKFVPHGSYGINHTKHNLEYGYLIVGLMQPSRKRRTITTTPPTREKI